MVPWASRWPVETSSESVQAEMSGIPSAVAVGARVVGLFEKHRQPGGRRWAGLQAPAGPTQMARPRLPEDRDEV